MNKKNKTGKEVIKEFPNGYVAIVKFIEIKTEIPK